MAFNQTLQIPSVAGSSTVLSNTTPPASFGNLTVSGIVGTASTTTNVNTVIEITQTTANITISLATPTANPLAAKVFTVKSSTTSTNMFTMYGANVYPGQTIMVIWNGTVFSTIWEPVDSLSIETASTLTYTSTRWNNVILCNATAQAVTVTLAANTIANIGKSCIVVKIAGANPVNITATGLVGTANVITDIGTAITYIPTTTLQTISLSGGGTGTGTVVARVATTTNGVLATAFANASIIDGILLATNDIILIKDQTVASENGVYRVNAAGAPTRTLTTDATIRQVTVSVTQGTVNGNIEFKNTNQTAITVGTTSITYANVSIGSIPNRPGNNVFAVSLTNYAANGSVGTAAATVDISSYFRLIQTTSSISVTLPTPSVIGTRMITFDNDIISSWAITVNGRYIMPGEAAIFFFNGAIWKPVSDVLGIVPIPTASVNGNILTAAASSDVAKIITFQQNTTGITSTLLNPTIATDYKTVTLCNLATSLFPITIATAGDTVSIAVWQSVDIQWNGTAWRLKSPAQVLPEFGEVALGADITTQAANTAFDILSFTLPSAGTWEIEAYVNTRAQSIHTSTIFLTDSANTILVWSGARWEYPTASIAFTTTIPYRITTTGSATYKLRGMANVLNALGILQNTATPQAVTGSTRVVYKKISGFSPVVGQSVDYAGVEQHSATTGTNLSTITSTNNANFGTLLGTVNRVVLTGSIIKGNLTVNAANGTIAISKTGVYNIVVSTSIQSAGTTGQWGQLVKNNATVIAANAAYSQASSAGMQIILNYTGDFVAGDLIDVRLNSTAAGTIGVTGYSYWVYQLGASANTKVVLAKVQGTFTGVIGTGLLIATTLDTQGSWNAGTWVFTAPRTADYNISWVIAFQSSNTYVNGYEILYLSGALSSRIAWGWHWAYTGYWGMSGAITVRLTAGQQIYFQCTKTSLIQSGIDSNISISELPNDFIN